MQTNHRFPQLPGRSRCGWNWRCVSLLTTIATCSIETWSIWGGLGITQRSKRRNVPAANQHGRTAACRADENECTNSGRERRWSESPRGTRACLRVLEGARGLFGCLFVGGLREPHTLTRVLLLRLLQPLLVVLACCALPNGIAIPTTTR